MTTIESTETSTNDIDIYIEIVARHLEDLPSDERSELLDDLRNHLREVSSENPEMPLEECVGSPESYANELLSSAGMTPTSRRKRTFRFGKHLQAAQRYFEQTPLGRMATEYAKVFAPTWWLVRAYLVVSFFAALNLESVFGISDTYSGGPFGIHLRRPGFPVPELFGSEMIGLLAVLALIPISVALGRGSITGFAKYSLVIANCVLAAYAVVLFEYGFQQRTVIDNIGHTNTNNSDVCLKNSANARITNLYPYDTSGKLLENVLLFDQNGLPVNNLCPEYDAQGRPLANAYGQDANGAPVYGLFPRKQTVHEYKFNGAPAEARPVPPPAVVIPQVVPGAVATTTTTTLSYSVPTTLEPSIN